MIHCRHDRCGETRLRKLKQTIVEIQTCHPTAGQHLCANSMQPIDGMRTEELQLGLRIAGWSRSSRFRLCRPSSESPIGGVADIKEDLNAKRKEPAGYSPWVVDGRYQSNPCVRVGSWGAGAVPSPRSIARERSGTPAPDARPLAHVVSRPQNAPSEFDC